MSQTLMDKHNRTSKCVNKKDIYNVKPLSTIDLLDRQSADWPNVINI